MKRSAQATLVVVGSADQQLEEMLRPGGAHLTAMSLDNFSALGHPHSPQPDVILVDVRQQSVLPPALETLKRHHPLTGVVIIASRLDPALMLDAMRAGVNEWVTEPVTPTALTAAVQRALARRETMPAIAQVLAFVGAKGGVGATTVAVNVATALAKAAPGKCLLIDLHLAHGDAALFLGVEPKFAAIDAFENIHRVDEAFLRGLMTHTPAGVDLLPSAARSVTTNPAVEHVHMLIELAARQYRYVILDVPRFDLTMLDALELASTITIVVDQELAAVRNASRLAVTFRQRYAHDRVHIAISRYDSAAAIGRDDVARVTGGAVRHLIPSDYHLALAALNRGQPLVTENHSRLAGSFVALARSLAGLGSEEPAGEGHTGIFGRRRRPLGGHAAR